MDYWGFDKIKPEKFDYLICVKLEKDYSNPEFYILSSEEAMNLPTHAESDFASGETRTEERLLEILENRDRVKSDKMKKANERLAEWKDSWNKIP